jgi:hypothetical protein
MTAYVPIFLHMKTPAINGRCFPLEPEYLIKIKREKGERDERKKEREERGRSITLNRK